MKQDKDSSNRPDRLARLIGASIAVSAIVSMSLVTFTAPSGAAAAPSPMQPAAHLTLPAAQPDQGEQLCLSCHSSSHLVLTLGDGYKLSLDVDQSRYLNSIHGDKLTCTDCHRGYAAPPHGLVAASNYRNYSIANYELCKRCHFDNYTKTLDSIHFTALKDGNPQAALCVDCHGSHYVAAPDQPRSAMSKTCSNCHASVFKAYSASVHGAALVNENNTDVPVCTDCHGVHNIQNPQTASFRTTIPELCGKCHTDEKLMAKYGLSTDVLKTYLQDFHGTTNQLLQEQSPLIWTSEAVCTDCHGIHDIMKVNDPQSKVLRANLVKTCQECHPGANENFPAAWLSHYEPSLSKAPLVFLVDIFYKIFIPFMVGGLALHILADIWRILSGRK